MDQINFLNVEFLFQKAYEMLVGQDLMGLLYLLTAYFLSFLEAIKPISFILSLLLIAGIVYVTVRHHQVHHKLLELYGLGHGHGHGHSDAHGHEAGMAHGPVDDHENRRWTRIEEHIHSTEEGNWRLAILEADIILDEMLESMGYHGDSVGEKLKQVEPSDFTTLDKAWEAHKIRNLIAHEGVNFQINHREAKRVISLYETVFKEFRFIK